MGLPRAHQVFATEIKDYLSVAYGPDNVCIDICDSIKGDLESEGPSPRVAKVLTKFLKFIG